MTATAKSGDRVSVHYTGKLDDGSVFDTSQNREPLEFVLGENRVLPGFESALMGMESGQSKTTTIPASQAYGEYQPNLVVEFERDKIPQDLDVKVGQELQVQTTAGQSIPARVVEAKPEAVKLDANHPLAGQDLTFEIELVDIAAT